MSARSNQSIGLDEVIRSINEMQKTELSTVRFEEYNEQYQYFLGLALLLLFIEFFVLDRAQPAARTLQYFPLIRFAGRPAERPVALWGQR